MNVIITGAGKGLGLELVRIYENKGDHVYALSHSLTNELKELSESGNVDVTLIELKNTDEIKRVLEGIPSNEIDMIFNVAGIWYEDQMVGIEDTDIDKVLNLYQVNAMAPLCIMKYGKHTLKNGSTVVNVSSEAGSIGRSSRNNDYGYCMSKAALNMASRIFQNEVANKEIQVFCYHPGWLRTQMGGERAAQSEESISARESAQRLIEILSGGDSMSGMFFDYLNNAWEW